MKTNAFNAYKRYLALRLHFNSDYNALKYNYNVRADEEKFRNKPEAYWFNKLSERFTVDDLTNAFVANFVAGKKWGGMHDPTFDDTYKAWLAKMESLTYTFINDLEFLADWAEHEENWPLITLADLFKIWNGAPAVSVLYLRKKINLETLVILDKLTNFSVKCQCTDTIIWPSTKRLIEKYRPFVEIDVPKFKKILLDHFPIGVIKRGQDLAQE
jgi:hypothetical protein